MPSLDPHIWGPPLWDALFALALGSRDVDRMFAVCRHLKQFLPCAECRTSYAKHAEHLSESSHFAKDPVVWLWGARDFVNQKLGKQSITIPTLVEKNRILSCAISDDAMLDCVILMAAYALKDRSSGDFCLMCAAIDALAADALPRSRLLGFSSAMQCGSRLQVLDFLHAVKCERLRPQTRADFDHQYLPPQKNEDRRLRPNL